MPPGRKKTKVVAEPSREREHGQSAVKGTYKDLKGDTSAAPALRKSSRIAARRNQSHQIQTLQPTAHPGSRSNPTTKSKQADARTKLATIQGKSSIQPRKTREDLRSGDPVTAPGADSHKRGRGRPKKAAGPIEQTPQDPGSGSQRRLAGPSISKATKPRARQNQTRDKSSKAQLTTAAIDSIPIGYSPPPAYSGESSDSDVVEQLKLQNSTTALTRKALEEHTRNTTPGVLVDQIRTIKRISRLLLAGNTFEQSPNTIAVDREEVFNYKWGYLPPLGEEAECLLIALLEDPTLARIMVRTGPDDKRFGSGLEEDRNVNPNPSSDPDPRSDEINALNPENFLPETMDQQRCHDELWRFDKVKCTANSSEALFQSTLMISLIARHTSVYQQGTGKTPVLDFSVEEPWQCPPMPTKAVWRAQRDRVKQAFDGNFLTQPKPDLSLCFNRESVISNDIWRTLAAPTKALACFEAIEPGTPRIFHFLTIEAKKAMLDIGATKAKYQSLNNASQALHNMYEFFNDAGSDHRKIFFDKVRFFSVVSSTNGMLVRIHRAVEISEDVDPRSLIMPDQPKYRLKFEYKEFARINEYSREKVLKIFRKILKYAVEDLGELIKAAALTLSTMTNEAYNARDYDEAFYRYGQPGPIQPGPILTKVGSDGNLVPSSRANQLTSVKRKLLKTTLDTDHTVPTIDQTMRSAADTERSLEAEPLLLQSHGAKKRSRNDCDAGFTDDENSPKASKRPKGKQGRK